MEVVFYWDSNSNDLSIARVRTIYAFGKQNCPILTFSKPVFICLGKKNRFLFVGVDFSEARLLRKRNSLKKKRKKRTVEDNKNKKDNLTPKMEGPKSKNKSQLSLLWGLKRLTPLANHTLIVGP